MAPRFPRRPRAEDPEDDDEPVRLDDDAHAWWSQRPAEDLLRPARRPPAPSEEPPRDILAEHFGPDWRTSWGLDPTPPRRPEGRDDPGLVPPEVGAARTEQATSHAIDQAAAAPGRSTDDDTERGAEERADAYALLGVEPTASWEEIVAAHRAMARRHHPDRAVARGPEAAAAAEERIRLVNAAYAELRVRRGR